MKSKVAIAKCSSYDYEKAKKAVEKAVALLGGIERFVKPSQRVLLKVNLLEPLPAEKGACTNPLFVKAVIELVQKVTPKIWVGDASGGTEEGITEKAFKASGMEAVIQETGAEKKNLQIEKTVPVRVKGGAVYKTVKLFKPVIEADVLINLPKLKTHGLTFYTGAIKNMFGCVDGKFRQKQHRQLQNREEFSQALVDIFCARKPELTIMDAIQAMQGSKGPSYGSLYDLGLVIASADAVALDTVASKIIGYNPDAIPTTAAAFKRKIGNGDFKNIEILGETIENCSVQDFELHQLFSKKEFKQGRIFNPVVDTEKCIKCRACEKNCPAGAITFKQFPEFDRKKCIHCFVCMEVCQGEAIGLEEEQLPWKRTDIKVGYLCNNNCRFCVVADKRKFGNKTTDEIKNDLRLAKGNNATEVVFTGGEPTIRKDLAELVAYAKKLGFKNIQIQSNGRMFYYTALIKKLIDAGATEFGPALHGHNAAIHDYLTKSKGAFEQTIQGIKNLKALKQRVIMNSVITKQNYRHLPELVELLVKLKVDQLQLAFVHPLGNAWQNFETIVPKYSDAAPFIRKAIDIAEKNNVRAMVEAVPLCFMLGYERFVSEQYIPETEIREVHSYTPSFTKARKEQGKKKGPQCKKCKYTLVCEGPWKEYPEKFGFGEFKPVKGKMVATLQGKSKS